MANLNKPKLRIFFYWQSSLNRYNCELDLSIICATRDLFIQIAAMIWFALSNELQKKVGRSKSLKIMLIIRIYQMKSKPFEFYPNTYFCSLICKLYSNMQKRYAENPKWQSSTKLKWELGGCCWEIVSIDFQVNSHCWCWCCCYSWCWYAGKHKLNVSSKKKNLALSLFCSTL